MATVAEQARARVEEGRDPWWHEGQDVWLVGPLGELDEVRIFRSRRHPSTAWESPAGRTYPALVDQADGRYFSTRALAVEAALARTRAALMHFHDQLVALEAAR